ncbi:MAG: T9SS type A sorting domain-containing protein, partial [Bacteroidota bacterium]
DRIDYERDGATYPVYRDPGPPPLLAGNSEEADAYLWGFELVLAWSAHLDPSDGAMLDISPGTLGNLEALPTTEDEVRAFYDVLDGGDPSTGHAVNPHTGQPYASQRVPRGDYTRVLAEFWADGPDSETPPGHWFTILNSVNDDPRLERRFEGTGPLLDPLEWDVKAYFALGGAMHDVAVAVWGLKGWYDYIRPISAIRAMGDRGQRSDPSQPGYDPAGVALRPGLVEVIQAGDPLAGPTGEHVGKLKAWAWLGPDAIEDPATDTAGVGWIRIEDWWPYQRPTFITPPFAGYVSGHSTFSRAAAEVLTQLTGDPFFPGGLGSFQAPQNAFLVFEQGPSVDVDLQWATYRDAADQCALSRIWGGIHPPADDLPGRTLGAEIGPASFAYARTYFDGTATSVELEAPGAARSLSVYPNPAVRDQIVMVEGGRPGARFEVLDLLGRIVQRGQVNAGITRIDTGSVSSGLYLVRVADGLDIDTARLLITNGASR